MASIKLSAARKGLDFEAGQHHSLTLLTTRRVRLVGLFFDLSKCFLLPSALPGIRTIKKFYDEHSQAKLLVVGHTDTSGREAYNETLSLERAEAVAAYLTDNVAAWEAFFNEDKPAEKLWGILEVQHMLTALPEQGPFFFKGKPNGLSDGKHKEAVRAYQTSKQDLKADGIAGPLTRKALITDYMALDQTSLPSGITLTTHGCGENFPVDNTADGVRDPDNRRVEMFFFDEAIDPAPPGKISKKGSTAYPKWLEEVSQTVDVGVGGIVGGVTLNLESSDGFPLPEVVFTVTFSDGTSQQGQLDSDGKAIINPPLGASFEVEYSDLDDIRIKSLSARLANALDAGDAQAVVGTLAVPEKVFASMQSVIEKHFPRSGDLIAEIRDKIKGTEFEDTGAYFIAGLGFKPNSPEDPEEVIAFSENPAGGEESGVALA